MFSKNSFAKRKTIHAESVDDFANVFSKKLFFDPCGTTLFHQLLPLRLSTTPSTHNDAWRCDWRDAHAP